MASKQRQIYLNLPVRDLKRSMEFFTRIGFEFNARFTDDKAACLIINPDAYVMLLTEPFFKTFTTKEICDTSRAIEGLFSFSCPSREAVDDVFEKAIAAGGTRAGDGQDHGFMYFQKFDDLDGHHWEVMWMDPKAAD